MENYILWGATADGNALSLLVTRVNLQRVGSGTAEFVRAMLEELDITAEAKGWSIADYFLTNYLTDNPDSDEWEDSWSETWDFRIEVATSGVELPASNDLRRTASYDETVEEDDLSFPVPLTMFAELDSDEQRDEVQRSLQEVFGGAAGTTEEDAPLRAAIDAAPEAQRAGMSAKTRGPLLQISLGPVDGDFAESSQPLIDAVKTWIEARGGAATWDERHT